MEWMTILKILVLTGGLVGIFLGAPLLAAYIVGKYDDP